MADRRHVLNPGGGALEVPDVDAAIAAAREEDLVLMVDVGGGMEIPLTELVDDVGPEVDVDAADGPADDETPDQLDPAHAALDAAGGTMTVTCGPQLPLNGPADVPGPYRVDPDRPRNVYRGDVLIGVMFDPALAATVVRALNGAPPADPAPITNEIT